MLPQLLVVVLEEQKHSSQNSLSLFPYQVFSNCRHKLVAAITHLMFVVQERCLSFVRNPSVSCIEKLRADEVEVAKTVRKSWGACTLGGEIHLMYHKVLIIY